LRSNGELASSLKAWIAGDDLDAVTPNGIRVQFISTLGSFTRQVPSGIHTNTLYDLAFRGTKGRNSEFELLINNAVIPQTDTPAQLQDGVTIHVHFPEARNGGDSNTGEKSEKMCLIKVYKEYENV
jgi:hypothetical protein